MRKPLTRQKIAVIAAVVIAVVAGAVWLLWPKGLSSHDALKVGGHEVTISALQDRSRALQALYGVQVPTDPKKLDQYWRDLAKSVALGYVVDDAASKDGITISDQQAEITLNSYIAQHYGTGQAGTAAFDAALGNMGTSKADVLAEIHRQLVVSKLFDRITQGSAVPSEADVAQAYKSRQCQLGTGEQRTIINIVDTDRAKADQALQQLHSGVPFATVAKTLSEDTSTSSNGGAIGTLQKAQLAAPYATAAFAAPLHVPFGPVKTQQGWNVGEVTAIIPPGHLTLAQVHDSLRDLLVTERKSASWQAWLTQQLREAHIQYASTYQPADPYSAAAPAVPTSAASPGGCPR